MPPVGQAIPREVQCAEVAALASEFLEGDLDDVATEAVAAHLPRCHACLRLYAELALTILAVHRLGPRLRLTTGRLAGRKG